MKFYSNLNKRKEIVREYIRKNPTATFKEIKLKLHTKIDKVYSGGIEEAYEDARVPKPRTLKFKTKEEKRKILFEYVKAHPTAGGHIIKRDTKINFLTIFKNTQDLFHAAGVPYPRENFLRLINRGVDEKRNRIIECVKQDPLINIGELGRKLRIHPYSLFKNTREIYDLAGIPYFGKSEKRITKKKLKVIEYIKNNSFATQREINRDCKTHVQLIFNGGIFEAYEEAGVQFPYERLNVHGVLLKNIRDDAKKFEYDISVKLSGYGNVNRLVKTKRGYADVIFERKGVKCAVEIKNYKVHEISISQVKQLNRYLEDIDSKLGFLICFKKPKKDTFLMGKNKIFVLEESELFRIPEIIDQDL